MNRVISELEKILKLIRKYSYINLIIVWLIIGQLTNMPYVNLLLMNGTKYLLFWVAVILILKLKSYTSFILAIILIVPTFLFALAKNDLALDEFGYYIFILFFIGVTHKIIELKLNNNE